MIDRNHFVVPIFLALAGWLQAEETATPVPPPRVIQAFADSLEGSPAGAEKDPPGRRDRFRHQIRNFAAMAEMIRALPEPQRPRAITYLASGAHLAPLVLCEALPATVPCRLLLTEIDAAVQEPIADLIGELARQGLISDSESSKVIDGRGERQWRFRLATHPVTITLRVTPATTSNDGTGLIRPADLAASDLVISHDWSGDPLGNLRLVYEYLLAARSLPDGVAVPLLMIEDLRQHPYPIDLSLFSPCASSTKAYGHRTSDQGVGRHGTVELGPALFGGGVLLAFDQQWWRKADEKILPGVFDFLLFNQFDNHRQNVLEGGDDPLIAPALLDWWTGYGERTINGSKLANDAQAKSRGLAAMAALRPLLDKTRHQRMACRVQLNNYLLQMLAAGSDIRDLLPTAVLTRRPRPGHFPSPEMEKMYRQALSNAGAFRAAKEQEKEQAKELLAVGEAAQLPGWAQDCPAAGADPAAGYRAIAQLLAGGSQ